MRISKELEITLSSAAKAKKIGESKVISAKSDVESAKMLREAADTLNSNAAMQIRYFETIQQMGKNQSAKILFLPLSSNN